jgi:hypothetical protein
VVEDTNKQKKETSINGNTESVTHSLKQQNKEETSKKSHSNTGLYGFDGLIKIFNAEDIDITNWITQPISKERGGIEFTLPNTQGEIYLTWQDLYKVDVTFVHTKKKYKEIVSIPTVTVLIRELEEQRQRTVAGIRDMLKEKFSGK